VAETIRLFEPLSATIWIGASNPPSRTPPMGLGAKPFERMAFTVFETDLAEVFSSE
jgi:hypothetical protein